MPADVNGGPGEPTPSARPGSGAAPDPGAAPTPLVRDLRDDDLDAVRAIVDHAIVHTNANFCLAPEPRAAWVARLAAVRPRHPWLVAELEGAVAGVAYSVPYRPRAAYAHTAEVAAYVHPDHRGRGLATALYAALLPRLEAAGFHTLFAGIALPNEPSERLHARHGFERLGVLREAGRKFDRWHDVALWQRRLRDSDHRPPEG